MVCHFKRILPSYIADECYLYTLSLSQHLILIYHVMSVSHKTGCVWTIWFDWAAVCETFCEDAIIIIPYVSTQHIHALLCAFWPHFSCLFCFPQNLSDGSNLQVTCGFVSCVWLCVSSKCLVCQHCGLGMKSVWGENCLCCVFALGLICLMTEKVSSIRRRRRNFDFQDSRLSR